VTASVTHKAASRSGAVIGGKGNGKRTGGQATISGGGITYVSRGADYAKGDGKPTGRAGEVGSVAAVQRRGGQDGRRGGKNRKQGGLRFFLLCGPRPRGGGCSSPIEPLRDGFVTGA
jgi:hypothetical protein